MEFDGFVAAAADNDFFAGKSPDSDLIGRAGNQGTAAARAEARADRFDGSRAFNANGGHRPAAWRRKPNDAKRG